MFCTNIYGPLDRDGYTTTLLLEVFTYKLCSRLNSIEIYF